MGVLGSTNGEQSSVTAISGDGTHAFKRVYAFIDGFNLYHALDRFDRGESEFDQGRFRIYKWLCLTSLVRRFLRNDERLVKVLYFTTYPTWDNAKLLRHQTYANAQKYRGVEVVFGEFKAKDLTCRASCGQTFRSMEEKQTDINIATSILGRADYYDTAILLTADSDQIPAIRLLKELHPTKLVISVPPIGRNSKDLKKVCDLQIRMTEEDLKAAQLPNPMVIERQGSKEIVLIKPPHWPSAQEAILDSIAASETTGDD